MVGFAWCGGAWDGVKFYVGEEEGGYIDVCVFERLTEPEVKLSRVRSRAQNDTRQCYS